jgi:hypothetical protein
MALNPIVFAENVVRSFLRHQMTACVYERLRGRFQATVGDCRPR